MTEVLCDGGIFGSVGRWEPVVSVLVLSYNEAPWLHQCLESVLTQETTFPYEVLVHDDASTDESLEVLKRVQLVHSLTRRAGWVRIRVVTESENQYSRGVNIVQQILLPMARGEYIAALEGDDAWCCPQKLQRQYDYLRSHPSCSLVTHGTRVVRCERAASFLHREEVPPKAVDPAADVGNAAAAPARRKRIAEKATAAAGHKTEHVMEEYLAGEGPTAESTIVKCSTVAEKKRILHSMLRQLRQRRMERQFMTWKEVHTLTQEEIFLQWMVHTSSYFTRRKDAALPGWAWECWCGDYVFLTWLSLAGEVVFLPEVMSLYRAGRPDAVTANGGGRGVRRRPEAGDEYGMHSGAGNGYGGCTGESGCGAGNRRARAGEAEIAREELRLAYLRRLDAETGYRLHEVIGRRIAGH